MQISQRIVKCTDMQLMYFILDKILKILTYYTLFYIISRCKVTWSQKSPFLAHPFFFLSFFLIWGDTRSLRMPALRPASQAGPMRNPREETSVVFTWHHQANLMVCVVCSCCATSPYREVCRAKGGIWGGETLCHDIYPARPIITFSGG